MDVKSEENDTISKARTFVPKIGESREPEKRNLVRKKVKPDRVARLEFGLLRPNGRGVGDSRPSYLQRRDSPLSAISLMRAC